MNHAELCNVTRSLGTIGCHRYIPTGSSQLNQSPKRAGTSPRTRPTNRAMPESGDNPRDDLTIAMLAY